MMAEDASDLGARKRCEDIEAAMRYHFECDRIEVSDDGVIGVKPSGETIVIAHPEDLAREAR